MRIGFDVTPLSVPRSGVGTYTACLLAQLKREVPTRGFERHPWTLKDVSDLPAELQS